MLRFSETFVRALAVSAAMLALTGCPTPKQLELMPGLAEVTPTGPKGRKCYDRCAQAEAACRHMCPKSGGICFDDCVLDTKFCLKDCPELQRPEIDPKNKGIRGLI